jgi:hypothetical protein
MADAERQRDMLAAMTFHNQSRDPARWSVVLLPPGHNEAKQWSCLRFSPEALQQLSDSTNLSLGTKYDPQQLHNSANILPLGVNHPLYACHLANLSELEGSLLPDSKRITCLCDRKLK